MAKLLDFHADNFIESPKSRNVEDLKSWLQKYDHLPVRKLAKAAGNVSLQMIRIWRVKCGMARTNPFQTGSRAETINKNKFSKGVVPNSASINALEDEDWVRERYLRRKWSIRNFAEVIGCNHAVVLAALTKFGLICPNVFKNKDWLVEHYCIKNLTIKQCAGLAGVQPETIYMWMHRFDIQTKSFRVRLVRDAIESNSLADKKDANAKVAGEENRIARRPVVHVPNVGSIKQPSIGKKHDFTTWARIEGAVARRNH